jgi:hypothetical protein
MVGWLNRIVRTPAAGLVGVGVTVLGTLAGCATSESADRRPSRPSVYPYLEVASSEPQDLARIRAEARVDGLILAFVVGGGQGCRPVWSRGGEDVAIAELAVRVKALRRAGGPIWISFGGAGGPDLAQVCDSVEELTAAYRAVVDAYQPDGIDLDVEGRTLADPAGNARRVAAVAALQRSTAVQGNPLRVSYTLPVAHGGIPREGVELLKESIAAGVAVTAVNVMIMNYGWGVADLGDEGVRQAGLAQTLVRRLWPDLSGREAWRRVALTVMVGRNDVPGEIFHPADARTVARFARTRGIGWLSYWSVERDRACPQPPPVQPSWRCSGVAQRPYEFAGMFRSSGR